jgi:hypothetical protein
VHRREPIIFRLGDRAGIDSHLKWNTTIWDDLHYLISVAGEEEVTVEVKPTTSTTVDALRSVFPFNSPSQYGVDYFESLDNREGHSESSVHQFGFGGSTYRKTMPFKRFLLGEWTFNVYLAL